MKAPVIIAPHLLLPGWDGYATPLCVVVRNGDGALIAHEQCHFRQWWRYGVIGFPFVYLWQVLTYGYRNAPLEVDAMEEAMEYGRV